MEDCQACRICLSTKTKLFALTDTIKSVYENLIGCPLSTSPLLPQCVCVYCCTFLGKYATFKQKCINNQNVLDTYVMLVGKLTPENIVIIKNENSMFLPYNITKCQPPIKIVYEADIDIKQEQFHDEETNEFNNYSPILDNIPLLDEVKNFSSSENDDEPLLIEAKKQKKRKVTIKAEELEIEYNNFTPTEDNDTSITKIEGKKRKTKNAVDPKIEEGFTIVDLSKKEQMAEVEARKTSSNYLSCLYKCDKCYKGFVTENTYKNHMIKHDPISGDYECDICHVRFPEPRLQRNHTLLTHRRQFVCKRCGHVDKSAYKATIHLKWHAGHVYTCGTCGATFTKPTTYLTHVRSSHPSPHACALCGDTFLSETGLRMHAKKGHCTLQNKPSTKHHPCTICSIRFKNSDALRKHEELSQGECGDGLIPCVECGEHFTSEDLLKQHSVVHKKEYSCQLCGGKFPSARAAGRHACGAGGARAAGRGARGESYVCHVCGATLSSKNSWMHHLRIHTGEKPFSCTYCPKSFSVHQSLKIHLRGHTGERPLQCARCPKAFRHRAALARHERVHTGVKPYRCPRCHKCFSQSNSCKLHLRTVHMRRQESSYAKEKEVDKE